MRTSGMSHRLLFLSCHPCRIAPLVMLMIVLLASEMLTVSLSKIVM